MLPSGKIRFSDFNTAKGSSATTAVKLTSMYAYSPSVPSTGRVKLSNLQGQIPLPTVKTAIGSRTVTTSLVVDLTTIFNYGSTYSVTSNPYSSAGVSGSTLTVTGASRGTSYTVTVQATNASGSTSTSFTVTEPTASTTIPLSSALVSSGGPYQFTAIGRTFTYGYTNSYGDFGYNTSWLVDGDQGTSFTYDQYSGASFTFSGTRTTGGVAGHYLGIFSTTSPFTLTSCIFTVASGGVGPPRTMVLLGSTNNSTFTNLGTYTTSSAGIGDSTITFTNSGAYNYYYLVITQAWGSLFVLTEVRWKAY